MYSDDDKDVDFSGNDQILQRSRDMNVDKEEEDTSRDLSVSSPWAIAKFNAAVHYPTKYSSLPSEIEANLQLPTPIRQAGDVRNPSSDDFVDDLEMMLEHSPIPNQNQARPC